MKGAPLRTAVVAVAVLALGGIAGRRVAARWTAKQQFADYPELWDADAALGRRVSEWMRAKPEERSPEPPAELTDDPAAASLGLVRALCARLADPAQALRRVGVPWDDAEDEPEACWLRDHPTPECD